MTDSILSRNSSLGVPRDSLSVDEGTRRSERDYDRMFTQSLSTIEDLLRDSGDIAHDSCLKLLAGPGSQVAHIDILLAEVGPDEAFRRLVIVEDKLSTNPEGRRYVLAQILGYAHRMQTQLTLDDFPDDVADWADDYSEDITQGMCAGDFLLIICGDAINEYLLSLTRAYVERLGPANYSDLVLIAMPIYSDGSSHVLVPHIVGRTERAVRDLTIRVQVQDSVGDPMTIVHTQVIEDRPEETPGTDPSEFMQGWVKRFGSEAANAWEELLNRIEKAQISGLTVQHFDGGGPYLALSGTSMGTAKILRLMEDSPTVRDFLHKGPWNTEAPQARERFREALLKVQGAERKGTRDRVSIPVQKICEHHELVIQALANLAKNLR